VKEQVSKFQGFRVSDMRNPHINLWPPSLWFSPRGGSMGEWKPDMSPDEAAQLIERFLDGTGNSIEWCDFAETRQKDPRVEGYRKCDMLSSLVNRPGEMDKVAVAKLRTIIDELRALNGSETLKR
jgi:hypothetical protein